MKKKTIIMIIAIISILIICTLVALNTNKTYYNTTYTRIDDKPMFIPKYSYFKEECCMTLATFYSLKSKVALEKEIDNYMKNFEYFENESTYGYQNNDLFIQSYEVYDHGFYRLISITY